MHSTRHSTEFRRGNDKDEEEEVDSKVLTDRDLKFKIQNQAWMNSEEYLSQITESIEI